MLWSAIYTVYIRSAMSYLRLVSVYLNDNSRLNNGLCDDISIIDNNSYFIYQQTVDDMFMISIMIL